LLRHETTELEALRRRLVLLKHDEPPLGADIELLRDDLRALGRPAHELRPAALRGIGEMCEAALAELRALDDPALRSLIERLELRRALVRTRLDAFGSLA
jgi:hypothetical protein